MHAFGGVEHRIELVRIKDGVKFYNDSIASSPSRTIAGLRSFEAGIPEKVLVVRDLPWMEADFATLNSYYATYSRSPFVSKRILYRCLPGGWISLTQNTVTRMTNGVQQTVELQTEAQVQALIEQEFDLFVQPL